MNEVGVYLHFPWCRKLCPYCDFAVEVGTPPHAAYADAVIGELARRADAYRGRLVSIYLGGGTPSLWDVEQVARVIAAIVERYGAAPREVTIEANPTDCTDARLAAWRAAGVNRVSIGVQSHDAEELVVLGRDHRFGDGAAAIARTRAAGFTTSADYILGVPSRRARPVMAAGPEHLSVYELTIEERTAFGSRVRAGRLVPLDEDRLTELYVATHDALTAAGYEHYEISSYARPGQRAVHNSLYWTGAPYLGLGVGAASLEVRADGSARRLTNPRRYRDYAVAPGTPAEVVEVTPEDAAAERAWLGMRTVDGVPAELLARAPGVGAWLVDGGLAEERDGRICPTLRGFLMADRVATRIVRDWQNPR